MKKKSKLPFQVTTKNSKILHATMVTLGALKEQTKLRDLPMNEIQVHILDKDGDGIVLCLEYDERTGELNKTFHSIDEATYDEYGENEENDDDVIIEVELDSSQQQQTNFEKVISEEYDEIFHNSSNDDEEPPPLLN